MVRFSTAFVVSALSLSAQLISNPGAIPHTGRPPVVFLNGFETDCPGSSFQRAFGIADQVLQANSRVSLFFNNCNVSGSPSIEKLGAAFGEYLAGLRFDDGQPVTSVDVVAYSMGGLILRSYLSGKQETAMTFTPPVTVPIGKAIFVATPNFGTPVAGLAFGANVQTDELSSGSHFLMDLNTWNQGRDDLRGIDAIAVAGTGGTGIATTPGFDDGLAPLSSASLGFYAAGRTRILPLCHVATPGLLTVTGLCPPGAKGIARVNAATDDNARILVSFLNGTNEWQTVGVAAEQNSFLANGGGLWVRARTAADDRINPDSVRAASGSNSKNLNMSNSEIAYTDLIPAGSVALTVNAGASSLTQTVDLPAGGARAYVLKTGPRIDAVIPAAGPVFPRVLAPRMIVAIYGVGMANAAVTLGAIPVSTIYVSDTQINAVLPDNAPAGYAQMTVRNGAGSHSIGVFVEPAFPAVFTLNQSGTGAAAAVNANTGKVVSPANPIHAGQYLELYLTGLGSTTRLGGFDVARLQPTVVLGGADCAVTYAGAAPGFPGLDQINCIVPPGLGSRDAAVVVVSSGTRSSPATTVSVQ